MHLIKKLLLLAVILPVFAVNSRLNGQIISFKQTKATGLYKAGEIVRVTAFPEQPSSDSVRVRILKNNRQVLLRKTVPFPTDSLNIFEGSFDEPCSVIFEIRAGRNNASIGIMVDPEKILPGLPAPDDFESYWSSQRSLLKKEKFIVKKSEVKLPESDKGYLCSDIEITCPGPNPVRGYYVKPENAFRKKHPAVLLVHAAGVKGSWCRSEPGNALKYAKMGAICFDINAHGMLNGQPEEYYAGLENGPLKNYFFQGLESIEDFYFRGMFLRLMRGIEFIARQPEWDGKRILVIGESQGGGQALAAAGLDKRVSAVVAIVPAMCDWMGPVAGRAGGWPQPFEAGKQKEELKNVLPYFDAANILKSSSAKIFVEIGLIDLTCPPASVYAAVNQSKGEKIIYAVPYRPHQQPQGKLLEPWQENVLKPREEFIVSYLK